MHISAKTKAIDEGLYALNNPDSRLLDLIGAMERLYNTEAIVPFNADPTEEKENSVGELARWVYEMLNTRVVAEKASKH